MSRKFVVVAILLGALALSPTFAAAQDEDSSIEQLVVEKAQTKAEHQALAKFYTEKAAGARKRASRHQGMARAYLGGKSMSKQPMEGHCKRIAEQEEAIAKEYDGLAKLHQDEATKAK